MDKENEIYVLIKLDAAKIVNNGVTVNDVQAKINELSQFGKINNYESLQDLALKNGIASEIEKPFIPPEIQPLINYINDHVKKATSELQQKLNQSETVLKRMEIKATEFAAFLTAQKQ